jgi:hypothetical protein
MKVLFQSIILLGVPHWVVSVVEFTVYRKTSNSLTAATIFFAVGFGGLVIYNRLKAKK